MKRLAAISAVGVVLALAVPGGGAQASPGERGRSQRASYIVVLHDSVSEDPGAVAEQQSSNGRAEVRHVYRSALKGYAGEMTAGHAAGLSHDPRVQFVQLDPEVRLSAQTLPTGIDRIDGEVSSQRSGDGTGAANVGVAVIDTGIDLTHPDLNVVGGKNCAVSFLSANDDNGHGSHVAGTIAARDDTNGVVGMAPGARLYAVKVLSAAGTGLGSWSVCGIDWVAQNAAALNIKVANMSLGGGGSDDGNCGNSNNDAQHKAICNAVAKGVTFVVAAGNDNADFKSTTPAAYDEVLTVTALADFNGKPGGGAASTCTSDVDDTSASYSNWTTTSSADVGHTIAGPGSCIRSTWMNGGYNTISGTSMATPHVAGAAALCIAGGACAGMTPAQVRSKLRADAAAQPASYGFKDDPRSPLGNRYYGYLVGTTGY